jgi:glycosyltransferase involved in cell wall biosynthesis
MMTHVAHLTSVHPRYDTRIFLKECISLAKNGYQVSLVVGDAYADEFKDGVHIYGIGASTGRLDRIRHAPGRIFKKAIELNADIYHLHDPELLPIGIKLKKHGKRVIFDAHEDVPKQILGKPYLSKPSKIFLSWALHHFETWACRQFDAVVAATPFIRDKFLSINPRSSDINNFPLLSELSSDLLIEVQDKQVCYVGGIATIRGIHEVVEAMGMIKSQVRLQLGGRFSEPELRSKVRQLSGWSQVDELGFLDRSEVKEVMSRSIAGLVTLHPLENYLDALPVKMFEYMGAGIPVIASDFPVWRKIVVGNDCGLCVDPMDPKAIADAIDYLVTHPETARRMGHNGKVAVQQRYNWQNEEGKLLALYKELKRLAA